MNGSCTLIGEKVMVCPLDQKNVKSYLSTYKRASTFAEIYEQMPDFWEKPRKSIEKDAAGQKDQKERYFIVEKDSAQGCGYIELDFENPERPEVSIAILEEYRRRGYAFEAARILLEALFKREEAVCVVWIRLLPIKRAAGLLRN